MLDKDAKVGFTSLPAWAAFSPVKNNAADAAKAAQGCVRLYYKYVLLARVHMYDTRLPPHPPPNPRVYLLTPPSILSDFNSHRGTPPGSASSGEADQYFACAEQLRLLGAKVCGWRDMSGGMGIWGCGRCADVHIVCVHERPTIISLEPWALHLITFKKKYIHTMKL